MTRYMWSICGAVILLFAAQACRSEHNVKPMNLRLEPVFLVAGQSNAVSPAQGHVPYYSQTGKVRVTDYYHGKISRIPTREQPMDGSIVWIYLGDFLDRPVEFVNVAVGGRSTRRWVEEYYRSEMVPQLRKRRFDAVLWHQGESDFAERLSEDESYRNMKSIILQSREIQPEIPWMIAINSMKGAGPDAAIRRAQMRIVADGLAILGPDTDVIRERSDWVEELGAEFVGDGLREHGRLWYEAMKSKFRFVD